MSKIRLHNIFMHTTTLGPGTRIAIWFQGCNRRCKGCMSPHSRPLDGGHVVDLDVLIEAVCSTHDVEGVTISGGEPFLQVPALHELLSAIRSRTSLGVIIYTGKTMTELRQIQDPLIDEIISGLSDIIIDGEYIDELNDGGTLKGSSNQTINYISDRYINYRELYNGYKRDVQIMIEGNDALLIGVPDRNTLKTWQQTSDSLKGEEETE